MSGQRRPLVAFYAPMKAPDHPVPSGDRTVARLYVSALRHAGFDVEIASELRVFDGKGDAAFQQGLAREAGAERERLLRRYASPSGRRPDLWFTYHVYHKSPDFIGPDVAASLGIPYVISEASRAFKNQDGKWAGFFSQADKALAAAQVLFVSTTKDWPGLEQFAPADRLVKMPPFIDVAGWPETRGKRPELPENPVNLITVAMMRQGDKLNSFKLLAESLESLSQAGWTLTIVGDGEARGEVEALFQPFGDKIRFAGQVNDRAELAQLLDNADVFVWPAVNEAYGMALLEAGLMGLPVVAGAEGGVSDVVLDGKTGFLTRKRDVSAFSEKIRYLMEHPDMRRSMGRAARAFVWQERSLSSASHVLSKALFPLLNMDKS